MVKIGFVYATHDVFHHINHEEHSDKDCSGSCTIIIEAEKSEKSSDAKSYKVSIDNFSSHLLNHFDFTPQIPEINFVSNFLTSSPPSVTNSDTPPPRI